MCGYQDDARGVPIGELQEMRINRRYSTTKVWTRTMLSFLSLVAVTNSFVTALQVSYKRIHVAQKMHSQSFARLEASPRSKSSCLLASSASSKDDVDISSTNSNPRDIVPTASEKCAVELIDPETGCHVVLLGCFHGSQSSAVDVERYLSTSSLTDVVVLELCASRFADLRRDFYNRQQNQQQQKSPERGDSEVSNDTVMDESSTERRSWWTRFATMVQKLSATRGLSTGAAAAVLGGVSGLQTALSGLEPGLEFSTALRMVSNKDMDIILADQNVDETLDRIGKLPQIAVQLWQEFTSSADSQSSGWEGSFGKEASALGTALLGDKTNQDFQIGLWEFLTRSKASVQDLIRLTLPPFGLLLVINKLVVELSMLVLGAGSDVPAASESVLVSDAASPLLSILEFLQMDTLVSLAAVGAFNAALVGVFYMGVALPAVRVVLRERDDRLAEGIRAACQLAVQKQKESSSSKESGRVVAVLGFLHVNGVALRLLTPTSGDDP